MFVHYYMVENYRKVPILLNLQKIIEGGGSNEVNTVFLLLGCSCIELELLF